VKPIMNLQVPKKAGNFLNRWMSISFSRRTLFHGLSLVSVNPYLRIIIRCGIHWTSLENSEFIVSCYQFPPFRFKLGFAMTNKLIQCTCENYSLLWSNLEEKPLTMALHLLYPLPCCLNFLWKAHAVVSAWWEVISSGIQGHDVTASKINILNGSLENIGAQVILF
jgi:hypothetical protein